MKIHNIIRGFHIKYITYITYITYKYHTITFINNLIINQQNKWKKKKMKSQCHQKKNKRNNNNDSDDNEEYSLEDDTWIEWFCKMEGNHYFVEISIDFLEDKRNLLGVES